ncbi:lasso peptide biosynthesis B2 protein [Emticicia fluvialis]|uniref:lasso peptide biosynthesis B2 protein n=1 Tax=Emticicia fluvialis TaxID=2974474 RepID=UPI002165C894|nr:lasso peptide biosynthesis B2 protein [Emticicia fluvialis]
MRFLKKIRAFFRWSLRRKLLLAFTVPLALYSFFLFRFFHSNARFGERNKPVDVDNNVDMQLVRDISMVIKVVAKYSFWNNVCRHQAYQAKVLCRLYGIPYKIYVGFKKNEAGTIEGHAWTTVNGQFVTGFCVVEDYVVHSTFA